MLPKPNTDRLMFILEHQRPHEGEGEAHVIKHCLFPYANDKEDGMLVDKAGNHIYHIPGGSKKILWSCHVDTVHKYYGKWRNGVHKQEIDIDDDGWITLSDAERKNHDGANCLGADDGAGMWMLLEMMDAKVPGTYIFHRGEEKGCVGSNWATKNRQDWCKTFDACIAFDRPGMTEVITHQSGAHCASDEAAWSFSKALNLMPTLRPSAMGGTTDSSRYRDLVRECLNVGIGYDGHHGKEERVNLGYIVMLRNAIVRNAEKLVNDLVIKRELPPPPRPYMPPVHSYNHKRRTQRYNPINRQWEDADTHGNPSSRLPQGQHSSGQASLALHPQVDHRGKIVLFQPQPGTPSPASGSKLAGVMTADDKKLFVRQLTRFINKYAAGMAEALVIAGFTKTDVQAWYVRAHGKLPDMSKPQSL